MDEFFTNFHRYLIDAAAALMLLTHIVKWVLGQVVGTTPKQTKRQVRAILDALAAEDRHTYEELLRILRLGVQDHGLTSVGANYRDLCLAELKKHIKEGEVAVGIQATTLLKQKAFLDAIAATLAPQVRSHLAACLTSHFTLERQKNTNLKDVVGIVGIKRGSPWLAIEVANKLHLPVSLHRGEERVNVGLHNPRDVFDGELPERGRVLIVDDSITGGTMVLEAVTALRQLRVDIDSCLVLFEVIGKTGRANLAAVGVQLIGICTYDGRTNELKKFE